MPAYVQNDVATRGIPPADMVQGQLYKIIAPKGHGFDGQIAIRHHDMVRRIEHPDATTKSWPTFCSINDSGYRFENITNGSTIRIERDRIFFK